LRLIGNIVWFVCGGLWMAMGWCFAGILAAVTIVGLPWAKACFVIAKFTLWPFGRVAVNRKTINGQDDIGTGTFGLIGNIIWILLAGVWLAIGHLIAAVATFITIVGIPFSLQHLKIASLAFAPIGKAIMDRKEAEALIYKKN